MGLPRKISSFPRKLSSGVWRGLFPAFPQQSDRLSARRKLLKHHECKGGKEKMGRRWSVRAVETSCLGEEISLQGENEYDTGNKWSSQSSPYSGTRNGRGERRVSSHGKKLEITQKIFYQRLLKKGLFWGLQKKFIF